MANTNLSLSTFQLDQRANFLALILLDALEDGNESDIYTIMERNAVDPCFVPMERGISPLHYACGMENAQLAQEVTKRFLQNGANPNVRSNENMTPLHIAALFGRVEIVLQLLQHGAEHDVIDDERKTPMHYAIEECHFEVLQAIRDHIFQDKYEQRMHKLRKQQELRNLTQSNGTPQRDSANHIPTITSSNKDVHLGTPTPVNKVLLNVVNSEPKTEQTPNSKYTPNRVHYNYDITSPYYINITHRRHKPQPIFPAIGAPDCIEKEDRETKADCVNITQCLTNPQGPPIAPSSPPLSSPIAESVPQSFNIFALTQKNLEDFSYAAGNLDQSCISMIEVWRERVRRSRARQSILRQYDNVNDMLDEVMQNEHLNFTNTILREQGQSLQTAEENESDEARKIKRIQNANVSLGTIIQQAAQAHVINSDDEEPVLESSYHTVPQLSGDDVIENINCSPEKKTGKTQRNIKKTGNMGNDYFLQMTEAYVHTDDENGLVFYETKLLSNQVNAVKGLTEQQNLNSTASTNLTIPLDYETDALRNELTGFGDPPGPITKSTKRLYIKRLIKYKRNAPQRDELNDKRNNGSTKFSVELHRTIRSAEHFDRVKEFLKYETQSALYFANHQSKQKLREGHLKQSFIYMLIDPRKSRNLPGESVFLDAFTIWIRFLHSIFYVGKGKTSRPYSHMYDAMKTHSRLNTQQNVTKTYTEMRTNSTYSRKFSTLRKQTTRLDLFKTPANKSVESKKLQCILDIWQSGKGVVCLHVFHNIMPTDAYTREAAIIDALSLQHLTNMKRGDYYGPAQTWTMKEKKYMGIALLYKAMQIYLAEGESQLSPSDLI